MGRGGASSPNYPLSPALSPLVPCRARELRWRAGSAVVRTPSPPLPMEERDGERRFVFSELPPLPGHLPARASQGEGASFSDQAKWRSDSLSAIADGGARPTCSRDFSAAIPLTQLRRNIAPQRVATGSTSVLPSLLMDCGGRTPLWLHPPFNRRAGIHAPCSQSENTSPQSTAPTAMPTATLHPPIAARALFKQCLIATRAMA